MPYLLAALFWLLHWLPFRVNGALGWLLGTVLYWIPFRRKRIAEINLRLCFPKLDEAERARLLQAHLRCLAQAALDLGYSWFASAERLKQLVQVEGMEHLRALDGQPVILFTGHLLGLEMGGMRLSIEVPLTVTYADVRNARLDRMIHTRRTRFGKHLTGTLISHHQGIRRLLQELKRGLRFYYSFDQDYGPKDAVFAPFFGIPTNTITGLPRLAAASGAQVLSCFTFRERNGYRVWIEPLPEALRTVDAANHIAAVTAYNRHLEAQVRRAPEQYLWLHRRFKTRPPGAAAVYHDGQ